MNGRNVSSFEVNQEPAPKPEPEPEPEPEVQPNPFPPLAPGNDWSHFLESGKLTDVIFAFPDGKELRAHKMFLIGKSPVFAAMFEHDTQEKQQNQVKITDVSLEVFQKLLKFIYSGQAEQLCDFAVEMLIAADKYALEELKIVCEKWLCNKFSPENVSDLLSLAEMVNASILKIKAERFIDKNKIEINPKKLLSIEQLAVITTSDLLSDIDKKNVN